MLVVNTDSHQYSSVYIKSPCQEGSYTCYCTRDLMYAHVSMVNVMCLSFIILWFLVALAFRSNDRVISQLLDEQEQLKEVSGKTTRQRLKGEQELLEGKGGGVGWCKQRDVDVTNLIYDVIVL